MLQYQWPLPQFFLIYLCKYFAFKLCFRAFIIQTLWAFLNDISFFMILGMVSINVPGVTKTIQTELINFIQLDFFYTNLWIPKLFGFEDGDDFNSPLNSYFDQAGYSSTSFILNLGSTLINTTLLFLLFVLYFFFFVFASMCKW